MGVIFQIGMLFFKSVRYFSNQSVIFNNPLMTDNGLILSPLQKIMQYVKLKNLQMSRLMHIKLHAITPMTTLQTQTLSGNTDVIIITPCCSHCDQWSS